MLHVRSLRLSRRLDAKEAFLDDGAALLDERIVVYGIVVEARRRELSRRVHFRAEHVLPDLWVAVFVECFLIQSPYCCVVFATFASRLGADVDIFDDKSRLVLFVLASLLISQPNIFGLHGINMFGIDGDDGA